MGSWHALRLTTRRRSERHGRWSGWERSVSRPAFVTVT